jgi:hypothetical protein
MSQKTTTINPPQWALDVAKTYANLNVIVLPLQCADATSPARMWVALLEAFRHELSKWSLESLTLVRLMTSAIEAYKKKEDVFENYVPWEVNLVPLLFADGNILVKLTEWYKHVWTNYRVDDRATLLILSGLQYLNDTDGKFYLLTKSETDGKAEAGFGLIFRLRELLGNSIQDDHVRSIAANYYQHGVICHSKEFFAASPLQFLVYYTLATEWRMLGWDRKGLDLLRLIGTACHAYRQCIRDDIFSDFVDNSQRLRTLDYYPDLVVLNTTSMTTREANCRGLFLDRLEKLAKMDKSLFMSPSRLRTFVLWLWNEVRRLMIVEPENRVLSFVQAHDDKLVHGKRVYALEADESAPDCPSTDEEPPSKRLKAAESSTSEVEGPRST